MVLNVENTYLFWAMTQYMVSTWSNLYISCLCPTPLRLYEEFNNNLH